MPHATVPSPGLQALILCGPGVSLNTFTSNPKDLPKALIPIANRPMVWYPLDWCYRMGITATLITPPECSSVMEAALATNPSLTSLPSPKPDILAPALLTQTTGTGELLRLPEVQKCITSDFVVLPCDLISELDGTKLIQQWLTLNPLPISPSSDKRKGGMAMFYPTQGLEGISTKKDETDFLASVPIPHSAVAAPQGSLRANIERIAVSMPTDTLNDKLGEDKGFLRLRQSLMLKHGRVQLRMKYRDAGVYVFPKWVKDYADKNKGFDSISEDLLGWWAKAGWQEGLPQKLALDEVLGWKRVRFDEAENGDEEDGEIDIAALSSTKTSLSQKPAPATTFASRVKDASAKESYAERGVPPLLAYVQPSPTHTQPLVRRVDTTAQLLSVSLYLAKQPLEHVLAHEHKISPSATLEQQVRVSQEDSLIGENVKLGFRSNVKESIVGANCEIGKNVRLTKCLIMDGVVVGDGVQMTGCIVGRRARIEGTKPSESAPIESNQAEGAGKTKRKKGADDEEERTRLTDCEIAPNFVVEAGLEAKGEKLSSFDTDDLDEDMEDVEEETEGED